MTLTLWRQTLSSFVSMAGGVERESKKQKRGFDVRRSQIAHTPACTERNAWMESRHALHAAPPRLLDPPTWWI